MEIPQNYLEKFGKSKERKPATNRIYLIQQIADQCGMTWREIFKFNSQLIERELQEALDDGKQAGKMKQINGKWVDKSPSEFQESVNYLLNNPLPKTKEAKEEQSPEFKRGVDEGLRP